MGLDAFEIVHCLEQRFNVRIQDEEFEYLQTPGHIHRLVWQKLQGNTLPLTRPRSLLEQNVRLPMWLSWLDRLQRVSIASGRQAASRRVARRELKWHPPALPCTEEQVWSDIVEILVGVLGVRPDEIQLESRMVEDLGMG